MNNGSRLLVIDSVWGHMGVLARFVPQGIRSHTGYSTAGGGSNARDDEFLKVEVRKFLEE